MQRLGSRRTWLKACLDRPVHIHRDPGFLRNARPGDSIRRDNLYDVFSRGHRVQRDLAAEGEARQVLSLNGSALQGHRFKRLTATEQPGLYRHIRF